MEQNRLTKHSRSAFIISSVGVILMVASVIFFIIDSRRKETTIAEKTVALAHVDSVAVQLKDSIEEIKQMVIWERVLCTAKALKEEMPNGDPLYYFTLQVNDSISRQLKCVEYYFDHPSYRPKLKRSVDSNNNFAVSYRGWGCMDVVPVYLHYKASDKIDTVLFPMCDKTKIVLEKI